MRTTDKVAREASFTLFLILLIGELVNLAYGWPVHPLIPVAGTIIVLFGAQLLGYAYGYTSQRSKIAASEDYGYEVAQFQQALERQSEPPPGPPNPPKPPDHRPVA